MTTKLTTRTFLGATALCALGAAAAAQENTTITIATVNNGDMIRMQALTDQFTESHPGIDVEWVTLEENVLRQNVTTDIATGGGQYDVITIGTYEVPIWGAQDWLVPLDDLPAEYDVDDLLPAVRAGLSVDGILYAAPFYGESSMTMYRRDLFEQAGLTMPEEPTWDFIKEAAAKLTDPGAGVYGICLRGKPGWGENMALVTSMANSYGARWFDMDWKPQFDSEPWRAAITDYVDLLTHYAPPGAPTNGFNENLTLFQQGSCAMWVDATSAGQFVLDANNSAHADQVGFALAPAGPGQRSNWLWAWALGIPASSDAPDAAKQFIEWATNREYTELVAQNEGWANVPPGTRTSLYENPEYLKVPFAEMTLGAMNAADPLQPTVDPVPYSGVMFVTIPEYQGLGTEVGQIFSDALAGNVSVDEALAAAQEASTRTMTEAGYIQQ